MRLDDLDIIKNNISRYESTSIFLTKNRMLFLKENITKEVAAELSALLLYYDNQSPIDPIGIYIHSNGGDADGLIQIYDVMQMIRAPIQTICIGKAYSAAAILLASGSQGLRLAFKNSKIMIHGLQCVFPIPGFDQINSKNYLKFLKEHNDDILKLLSKHCKKSISEIKQDCKRDLYFNAKQAIDYGIIDGII